MTALPFSTSERQSNEALQIVHSDVVGPLEHKLQMEQGTLLFLSTITPDGAKFSF